MKKITIFLMLFLPFASVAAQTPSAAPTATLAWTAPTQYTDGTAIPSSVTITYNVYQGTSTTNLSKVATGVTALTSIISTGLSDGVAYYWSVTAVANGLESAQVTPVSKVFSPGTPGGVISLQVK